ncbi:MAG: DNA alkylation repair protein [Lachnospiraceae bacterium]|nr:DNA alkylation repair protein [Lachnospiraceae bacterium]
MTPIQERLFALQDLQYKEFHSGLVPTAEPDYMIGVRVPQVRKLAKEVAKEEGCKEFLLQLPHKYYEENNLHAFIIEGIKDYEECLKEVNLFLPYVDNWATCDSMSPKVFGKHLEELLPEIDVWLTSGETYTIRFGIGMLMRFYLDEHFSPEYPEKVASVVSEEYYVNMMRAWYFATALAKQYDATVKLLEEKRLDAWTHNKTIQKAVESYRITPEQKKYLRTLKVKSIPKA